jgi:hypothetical protein
MATAVAHNPADLFALQVAIDAGHPGVDLGKQQPLVGLDDVIGPGFRGTFPLNSAPQQHIMLRHERPESRPLKPLVAVLRLRLSIYRQVYLVPPFTLADEPSPDQAPVQYKSVQLA